MQLGQIIYSEDFTWICQLQNFICHHSGYSLSFARYPLKFISLPPVHFVSPTNSTISLLIFWDCYTTVTLITFALLLIFLHLPINLLCSPSVQVPLSMTHAPEDNLTRSYATPQLLWKERFQWVCLMLLHSTFFNISYRIAVWNENFLKV